MATTNVINKKCIAKVFGVPVYVYWSLPFIPFCAFVIGYRSGGFSGFLYYLMGFPILVFIHELGHAFAARSYGCKVVEIGFSLNGGRCSYTRPQRLGQNFVIYASGILAQGFLLIAAVIYVGFFGEPLTVFGNAMIGTFVVANGLVIVGNLIPYRGSAGLPTDGYLMWRIIKYQIGKAPHPAPYIAPKEKSPVFPPDNHLLDKAGFASSGFKFGIEILNDNVTPMEIVVECLEKYLGLKREWAVDLMIKIHNNGGVLVSLPSMEKSIQVALSISQAARQKGYPLVCRAVNVDDHHSDHSAQV